MFGLLARSYRHIRRELDGEPVDIRELLRLAIDRSNHLLISRFSKGA
jgi:hypothetical protein